MLSKHFAILGTTGVGKSSGVALILQQILAARPNLRLFLLDGHNEYARCFGDKALVLNPRNLKLPFWLFNFEETVDVFFSAAPAWTRSRAARRADPAGEEQLHPAVSLRANASCSSATIPRRPDTPATRRCRIASPTWSR
jgi:DNA helicase HerA-like ATPase